MSFLYVTEQGAYLRKSGESLVVEKNNETIINMPLREVETAAVFGNVQVSSQALLALLEQGCDTALLSSDGHFRGRVVSSTSKNSEIRRTQFVKSLDPAFCLDFSKRIVISKVCNGSSVLRKYHNSDRNDFVFEDFDSLKECIKKVENAENLDELRGYEGNAAKIYFSGFKRCLKDTMGFEGRKYFPATDPVNALLSFGYSFVSREWRL